MAKRRKTSVKCQASSFLPREHGELPSRLYNDSNLPTYHGKMPSSTSLLHSNAKFMASSQMYCASNDLLSREEKVNAPPNPSSIPIFQVLTTHVSSISHRLAYLQCSRCIIYPLVSSTAGAIMIAASANDRQWKSSTPHASSIVSAQRQT
jgi:hypothetical protein